MDGSQPSKRTLIKQGLRALQSCGDGFWELDLAQGTAWFSPWFYERLGWKPDSRRNTLAELEPHMAPAEWQRLMEALRAHLEQGRPLDVNIEATATAGHGESWRIRGRAHRNEHGQPLLLAGSMSQLPAPSTAPSAPAAIEGAFEALPVAAALLDGHARLLQANRQWQSLPAAVTHSALSRLRAANSQTAIEFWLDPGKKSEDGARPLRVRAVAFLHQGERHLIVTLEDRRSD